MPAPAVPIPAPGEDQSVALALVNSELRPRGERLDLVGDEAALGPWLADHGLASPPPGELTHAGVQRMSELRAAVRQLFLARISDAGAPHTAIRTVNSTAALVPRVSKLRWPPSGPRAEMTWPSTITALDAALASIADDAIHTVLGERGERLRACEARGCDRLFLQDHGRRKWCSRSCGDRVRFARHYRRLHPESSA